MITIEHRMLKKDAANELGLSPQRISQLVKERKLGTIQFHGREYISGQSIKQYLAWVEKERIKTDVPARSTNDEGGV